MNISLSKLQQLITVARCGSFSRAAEELNISQPALSRSIATIERLYGFAIFNRIGHGVEATAAGMQMLEQAGPLLQTMRVFDRNMELLSSGKAGSLKIGLPPLLASQLLADLAQDFFGPSGKIEMRVSTRSAPRLLDELKNDLIEFLLFAETQLDPGPEIATEPVGWIVPACVVRSGHPLAGRKGLTRADLADFPWASSVEPPAMGELLNPARFLCDNYHALREAVIRTDLVCICTRAFVEHELAAGSMREIEVAGFIPDELTVFIASLKGRAFSPLANAAIARIRSLLGAS
jgi:DNA-binding transcriptional LysR family regulator